MKVKIDIKGLDRQVFSDLEQDILESFQEGMRAAALKLQEYAQEGYCDILKRMRQTELRARIKSLRDRGLI